MAKKRINKRPNKGHLYSWAGIMEFMQNNPELMQTAAQAASSQSRDEYSAISPVQHNVNTQQPVVQQNPKYGNPSPTLAPQQREVDASSLGPFGSIANKVNKLNNELIVATSSGVIPERKMGIPKNIWKKYYDAGGWMAAIDGGLDIATDVVKDFQGLNLQKQKDEIEEVGSKPFAASSSDEVLDSYNDITHLKHVGLHDITGGSYFTDVLGGLNRNAIAFGKGWSSTGSPWGGAAFAAVDLIGQIGGYFRRRNQVRKLNKKIDLANAKQIAGFNTAAENYENDADAALYRNYLKGFDGPYLYSAAFGGPIHIADSKKGTFTAAASKHGMGVQEFASKVLANKENYSPAMVKKANFARNAAHWHAAGGNLFSDFNNGVTIIDNGGTHEENPYEGVQMGIAPDGKPNLVEEGEAIYKPFDYVFSNRLKVPKAVREKYKLRGPKDMTFAEAFKSAQKESEERPNDPISKKGLENSATILAISQEALKQKEEENMRKKAKGGHLFAFGIPDNYPTNYILDNTSTDNKEYLNYNFTSRDRERASDLNLDLDDADDAKKYLEAVNGKTNYASGMERVAANAAAANNRTEITSTETTGTNTTSPNPDSEGEDVENKFSPLRYFSTLANAGAVLSDIMGWTNKPTRFNQIKGPALVRASRLGNYLPEMHIDTRYEANALAQQAAATRRALMQGISPSRAANILATDYNAQVAFADLMRKAELANYDLAVKRAEFNRGTDQANAQMALTAAMENAKNKMANAEAKLKQAKMNDEAETLAWAAKSQNAKALAENISNIGKERDAMMYRDMFIRMGPTLADYMRPPGWSDEEWEEYKKKYTELYEASKGKKKACGGKIKRRRGLTY